MIGGPKHWQSRNFARTPDLDTSDPCHEPDKWISQTSIRQGPVSAEPDNDSSPPMQLQLQLQPESQRSSPSSHVCNELSERGIGQVGNQLKFLIRNQSRRLSQQERERYESRLATVMKIYHKILNASPLSAQMSCPAGGNSKLCPYNHGQLRMLECRRAVLDYIESLNGYCGSINILRQIMRSSSMTGVMLAFDSITERIVSANQS